MEKTDTGKAVVAAGLCGALGGEATLGGVNRVQCSVRQPSLETLNLAMGAIINEQGFTSVELTSVIDFEV